MITCNDCQKYNDCNYKHIMNQLSDNINLGIQESNVPFHCEFYCNEYVSLNKDNMLPKIDSKNDCTEKSIIYNRIYKEIKRYPSVYEDISTLRILCIYKIEKDVYIVIAHADYSYIINEKNIDKVKKYLLYMNVYIIKKISFLVYDIKEYKISLTSPRYMFQVNNIFSGCNNILKSKYAKILISLIIKNGCEIYKSLCWYGNSFIRNNYLHTFNADKCRKSQISVNDIPNYTKLLVK